MPAPKNPHAGDTSVALDRLASEFARVHRAHRTLSAGNRTLLRASNEQDLLRDMCQVIVETGGYSAASVAYAENDENRRIRWMVSVGTENEFLQSLPFTWADREWGGGAVATAIRTGQPSVARNYRTDAAYVDPAYKQLREHMLAKGFAATTAFPLIVDGVVVGALTMAAPEPDAFDDQEVVLLAELAEDLAYGIGTLRTRARHQAAEATISHLAYFDTLTGLPNRLQLVERLEKAMQAARLRHHPLALMHMEVGRFHEINKVLGYRAGDELVKTLAQRLVAAVPESELIARIGETEFALLLHDRGAEYAVQMAQRLAGVLHEPVKVSDLMVDPHVIIGIALFPGHAAEPEVLIRRANAAMQQATPLRGGYAIYAGGQEQENTRRLALMSDLYRAIQNNELQLFCQPKVDIATRNVFSAEALVRWSHPLHGVVSTGEFVRLAEHAGMITPLTNWMLNAAFSQCHAWQSEGLRQALAVNLSAQDLYDPGLIDRIRDLFSTWGIAPECMQFELTESALMADPEGALETLSRLKRLGVQLFVDDYGTGYSSLSYLQKLPIDAIKIDQSFVTPMASRKDSAVIVSSTIELGHKLGLQVVAEGVESQDVWDQLAAFGCDVAQGYLISRPMPAEQLGAWRQNW